MSERIKKIFEKKGKKLVTFTTGGDPDFNTSLEILKTIINNGIDIIEIGMPFSDPMADGPTIQESSVRSLANGTKINDIFKLVTNIRKLNNEIPIILMGYYNSIFNSSAIVKISLSPLPHIFITTILSLLYFFAIFFSTASA